VAAILLIAHQPLAAAFKAVAEHAFPGACEGVHVLDIAPNAPDPEAAVRAAIGALGAQEVLILTDAFGATPSNLALKVAQGAAHIRVVSGVNVPMLWRTLGSARCSLDELVTRAMAGATQGVMHVTTTPRQNQPVPPNHHAQDHDQDQQ
jgi:mannose PTS system EIIA component